MPSEHRVDPAASLCGIDRLDPDRRRLFERRFVDELSRGPAPTRRRRRRPGLPDRQDPAPFIEKPKVVSGHGTIACVELVGRRRGADAAAQARPWVRARRRVRRRARCRWW